MNVTAKFQRYLTTPCVIRIASNDVQRRSAGFIFHPEGRM